MMGIESDEYKDLSRLYFLLHSDHESGNVTAHATHLVGSALADVYYATSSGLSGLAGPLHGLANQECLGWLLQVYNVFQGVPDREELRQFAWETLNSWQVIPGYGHAVLRKTDPRFTAQLEFEPPFGFIFRWLGGIPVDRFSKNNVVEQTIAYFEQRERMILAISPEGTRKRSDRWRTGFYWVAVGAKVPIVPVAFDFPRKRFIIHEPQAMTGDAERGIAHLRSFFKAHQAYRPAWYVE